MQPVLLTGLGSTRPDGRHHGVLVGFASDTDEVAHRGRGGEGHGVEFAGLDGIPCLGWWWGSSYGAITDDVLDLPAQVGQLGRQ